MIELFKEQMEQELKEFSICLTEEQMAQFYDYYELLLEWNKVMNLTTITDMEEVVEKHFVDSLSLIRVLENLPEKDYTIIDVGTGAGFPGIPLKIAFPNLKITLLDSLNKRVKFLDEVIRKLGLKDIKAVHGRAEDLGRDKGYREQYDICVSRAVSNMATLAEYCMPYVNIGGYFVSYKSGKIEEELNGAKGALYLLSGKIDSIELFILPKSKVERALVKIKKVGTIGKAYPRKAGMPGKEPLK